MTAVDSDAPAHGTEVPTRVRVRPGTLEGNVRVPGDKSISHRALIVGALVGAPVPVRGVAPSGDVATTAAALRRLGVELDLARDRDGWSGRVTGPPGEADDVIDCGNSGTSLRLLAGMAAGLDAITVLTGDASLRRRPVDRVVVPLRRMGADLLARAGDSLPPLVVRGGRLSGITYDSPVASAQVKSAVLLAGLNARGGTSVRSPARSRDHTERMLGHLGGTVEREIDATGNEIVRLSPTPLRARELRVPGDPSSAAFWLVAGAIGGHSGRRIQVRGVCANPTRLGVVAILRELGAEVELEGGADAGSEPVADITVHPGRLGAAVVRGAATVDALDELPVLAVAGAVSEGGLDVHDAGELRVKESDRIDGLARRLAGIGITVHTRPDGFSVPGGQRPRAGAVDAGGDHRIAMTACIAATIADGPVEITGFESVATSYPGFIDDLRDLGGSVEIVDVAGRPA